MGTAAGDDAETVFGVSPIPSLPPSSDSFAADTTGLPPLDTTGLPPHTASSSMAALGPLKVGQRFGSRYTILQQLGIGGMGAVYQAWDAELNVAVALKVIRSEAAHDADTAHEFERRFKQELLLARQVTHKNVVRIHDLGEIGGVKYITMPYIEGADLATLLRDTPKLPIPQVMSIVRQVAAGLQAAHEAGVVHRDLKPANVMIEHEHAIIMDFGIARSTSRVGGVPRGDAAPAAASSGSRHDGATLAAATVVGAVIGTIEYMAPEQARGEHVDHRADIYAFGLIAYDMLAGRRRIERAPSAVYELEKRMGEPPPSIRSIVPQVPEALDKLVMRCIEPDAAKRFQTAGELLAALDRLDDNGKLRPVRKVVGVPYVTAAILAMLLISGGSIWYFTRPPVQHEPVAVMIADLENRTRDPAFDRVLEPMLKRALEGAGFITAYDRTAAMRTFGVQPEEHFGEVAARELAVKQGLGVVLSGTLEAQSRGGYRISFTATQAVTGDVITTAQGTASGNDQLLEASTRLMARIRSGLGDDESESSQIFAMTTLSATSLEVVRHFATALEAQSRNRFEEARDSLLKAVELDPRFGIAYQSLAVVSRNLGQTQEAQNYIKKAVQYLDGMTDRERYNTRGMSARITRDYQLCAKEYGALVERYAADIVGRNGLALCLTQLRRPREAVDQMRRVVQLLPNLPLFRTNLSYYASYAGDFATAEQEARAIQNPDRFATRALALALIGQGRITDATAAYKSLLGSDPLAASIAASGLADIAVYEGRFSDAVDTLRKAARADLENNKERAGAKYAALAQVHANLGDRRAAVTAAGQALSLNQSVPVRFLVARTFVEAGETEQARAVATMLAAQLEAEPRAYAKIVEAGIALKAGEPSQAISLLEDANKLLDTWIGHFDLGRAYLQFGGAETRADSEFDDCLKRRGEAISLFLDEEPTYSYFPAVYYYQGLGRQRMGTAGYRDSFEQYRAIRGKSTEDPLMRDIHERIGS
jgi:tetratricopeptide (TPR) repeat protein